MINFVKYSKLYYIFSGIIFAVAVYSLISFGLKFGIDFTGGSILEVRFEQRPENAVIQEKLKDFNLGEIVVQPTGEKGIILKTKEVSEETHQSIIVKLGEINKVEELSFESIGPVIGKELEQKTRNAIILALIAITLYITFAFRKISKVINSWQCGIASLIALFHDILIPLGVFAVLGKLYNIEITIPIIAALLTILGFSVHDTIVIFDRIRENVLRGGFSSFGETVNVSLNQTLGRSINTVLTVLIVLFAIFFFGGQTLKYFSLALIIGITSGAYSSIFIASSLLVSWFREKKKA
ncbi:MAG: protein translocase subunit SecF [bacterium]|nr:protein translocase subunit SecF [bacterium]